MRTAWLYLTAILVALLQAALHGMGAEVVVPNLCLVMLIWLTPRLTTATLAGLAVTMGVLLESVSGLAFGSQLLGLLVLVLIAKLVLREKAESKLSFQILITIIATLSLTIIAAASLPIAEVAGRWHLILFRGLLESLYNVIIIVGLAALTGGERQTNDRSYHLPHS